MINDTLWQLGVVLITTAQLHSTKAELRFHAGSNPAHGMSEICNGEDFWQWSQLDIRLKAFCWSTTAQKYFINTSLLHFGKSLIDLSFLCSSKPCATSFTLVIVSPTFIFSLNTHLVDVIF